MKHAVEQCHRGGGIQKQSIRPSFGKRNKITKPRTAAAAVICSVLWTTAWLLFVGIIAAFLLKILPTLTIHSSPPITPPPSHKNGSQRPPSVSVSVSLLNAIILTFFKGNNTHLRQDPVLKTSVMYHGLKRCFWGFRREGEAGRSDISTADVHCKAFTHLHTPNTVLSHEHGRWRSHAHTYIHAQPWF